MSSILDKYCEKYVDINEDTLQRASTEVPELLVELFYDQSLRPLTRAIVLQELCVWSRDEHWDLCVKALEDESPLVRESAAQSLVQYATRDENPRKEARNILKRRLKVESGDGVIKQIKNCIESIEFYSN